jgi:hypothetical protein
MNACLRCSKPGKTDAGACTCPLVCVCPVARPTGQWGGECVTCLRPVVALWSPDKYRAAIAAYPHLTKQTVDWTFRTAVVTP